MMQVPLMWDSFQNFAALFIFFWLLAVVFHHLFCRKFQWYYNQVQTGTIQVSFGRLYLTSHFLNGPIQTLGSWPRLVTMWRIWFICGVLVSSILIVPVLIFLLYLFLGHLLHFFRSPVAMATNIQLPTMSSSVTLVPVVPGVNLPVPNILPFFFSVLVSTFFHELGHGISAASELTEVSGVGLALIGVFPAAFVVIKNLDSQALTRQLRIMAAGVWHNFVLALFAVLLLWNSPLLLRPFFPQGKGVTVVQMLDKAVSNHTVPFLPGMEIYGINNCSVTNTKTLERCSISYTKPGFCLSLDTMKSARDQFLPPVRYGDDLLECCKNTSSSLCFRADSLIVNSNGTGTLITSLTGTATKPNPECLQVRKLIAGVAVGVGAGGPRCNTTYDCSATQECYIPYLSPSEGLFIFNTSGGPVLFVGEAFSLLRAMRVSNYSADSFFPLWVPQMIEMTLKYFVSVSAALAVLNLVPCIGLDGQHVFSIWIELLFRYHFLPSSWSHHQLRIIQVTTVISTVVLVADILLGFFTQM